MSSPCEQIDYILRRM